MSDTSDLEIVTSDTSSSAGRLAREVEAKARKVSKLMKRGFKLRKRIIKA